ARGARRATRSTPPTPLTSATARLSATASVRRRSTPSPNCEKPRPRRNSQRSDGRFSAKIAHLYPIARCLGKETSPRGSLDHEKIVINASRAMITFLEEFVAVHKLAL